jgi:hypothetical protein
VRGPIRIVVAFQLASSLCMRRGVVKKMYNKQASIRMVIAMTQ